MMSRYVEDPSIAEAAALEHDRVWDRIIAKVEDGAWFFRARELVLAEEIPDITKAYGKEVARRVQQAIQYHEPPAIPSPHVAELVARDLGLRGLINRLAFRLWGVRLI